MSLRRARLRVRGLVQGVNFRYYAQQEARRHGLTGWVRNCEDGDVEIVAEGEGEPLASFISWCHRGPRAAVVRSVDEEELGGGRRYRDFRVTYEALE